MSDSISDFLTIIRNACLARQDSCQARYSKLHLHIAQILKDEGYLREVSEGLGEDGHKRLFITLKYVNESPAITGLRRHSTPGRRVYFGYSDIPRVLGGLGVSILTTSKGVMRDRDARRLKIGGELICSVW